MAKNPETKTQEPAEDRIDDRVDDFARDMFTGMGYDNRQLPDSLVRYYNEFKRRKDKLYPGRVTPEGFAFVAILSELTEGNLNPEEASKD